MLSAYAMCRINYTDIYHFAANPSVKDYKPGTAQHQALRYVHFPSDDEREEREERFHPEG